MVVSEDVGLEDVDLAASLISQEASPDANVIWGVAFDPELEDEMKITIIATGFQKKPEDANRGGATVKTNPGSPFRKEAVNPNAAVQRPASPAPERRTAPQPPQRPVIRPAAPAQRPAPRPAPAPAADDDFDDLFNMVNRRKN